MTTTGPNSPGTTTNNTDTGSVSWTATDNAKASDNVYATAALAAVENSFFLLCTNFGFTIPAGATIDGVTVDAEAKASTGAVVDIGTIKLFNSGAGIGSAKNGSALFTTSDVFYTSGSASDVWGATLSDTIVNGSTFGVGFGARNNSGSAVTVSVDFIRITIDYTPAAAAPAFRRSLLGVGV